MTFWEFLSAEKPLAILAGLAGAAAMAATDWRTKWRLIQHIFVGTASASVATPLMAPAISTVLGFLRVDPAAHGNASAFLVGAFSIYLFEFILAFWHAKIASKKKDNGK